MIVAELIEELEKVPQDYNVVYITYDKFGNSVLEDVTNILVLNQCEQIGLN